MFKKFFILVFTLTFIGCSDEDTPATPIQPEPEVSQESKIELCSNENLNKNDLQQKFNVFNNDQVGFTQYKNYFENLKALNPSFDESNIRFNKIDTGLTGSNKFKGGALSVNGIIFLIPVTWTLKSVYALDPDNLNLCRIPLPDGVTGLWTGATSLPDGRLISFPHIGEHILEINPYNLTVKSVGKTEGTYGGQLLAPNGLIYGVPYNADHILRLNPSTYELTKIGNFKAKGSKWYSSSLGPNGKIYGIPLASDKVLEFDPSDETYKFFGEGLPNGGIKWSGSVLATNGKIYGIPDNFNQILEIDPSNESTRLVGNLGDDAQKWSFGFLGPDAKIYMTPDDGSNILQYDPIDDSINFVGNFEDKDKWNGIVQANGKFYLVPDSSDSILEVEFDTTKPMESFIQLSPFINKY